MRDAKPIFKILALLLLVLALFMLPPIVLLGMENDPDLWAFLQSMGLVALVSVTLLIWTWRAPVELKTRHMFILTTLSWVLISAFASLPLVLGAPQLSFSDAVFESVSAITTTGSTVLSGIEHLSDGLKLWRGLMQWFGGIGIIVMAIAILPFLKVGGMRLFQTESSDWSDKVLPRAGGIAKASTIIYLGFTLVAFLSYRWAGMGMLDAIVHAMSSVSTGGFANYDASFGIYHDRPLILWLGCLFMLAGALPFVLYIRLLRDSRGALWRDQQVRGLLVLLALVIAALTLYRTLAFTESPFEALTEVAFNVISVVTTTGYASDDYTQWGPLAVTTFFFITFVGGCSGSTSGGIKIFRFQIGVLMLVNQLRYLVHPSGVFAQRYNGRPLNDEVVRAVIAFSFFFFLTVAVLSLALAALGLDMVTAITGASTALTNVGPGLGEVIGPSGNFASLPDAAKWLLCVGMLMGRLEILTVLVLLMPFFWRK
ncbi:TrkH family potassium uptake protein [Salinicola avicenniae]|uniref:TrkH family potassium uptake protein n=1 Tax=Salinicola avicenniae TaxID=2916836 RepID=UPI00255C7BBA|nr:MULTISPECIES: TrkH family potassium uptake protein [unclassified Salinicola]